MEQHPIPQQISSYQFRLVGDMTLKQFFQIAGGALISLLIYASGLHPLIKWPGILFFALLGVGLAFFPFEDRPLDRWIIAFFRSIYSPTEFFWKKGVKPPTFFRPEIAAGPAIPTDAEKTLYTSQLPGFSFFTKLEGQEKNFLDRMSTLLGSLNPLNVALPAQEPPVAEPPARKEAISVPQEPVVSVPAQPKQVYAPPIQASVQNAPPQMQTRPITPVMSSMGPITSQVAQFSTQAAPPHPPNYPNTVSGQVMTNTGEIVESAILEIRDSAGRPVRALRSNKAGHFLIVTPLQNGTYEIITEKEGWDFENVKFDATGGIIPPIAIRAKQKTQAIPTAIN